MENLLQGIPQVSVYIDDILITGHTESEHVANVEKVLERLSLAGMKLRREKCIFMAPEVLYLGHKITKHGIEPTEEKVEAIVQSPRPTNMSELKAFLGLINYYGKLLPKLSTILNPLYSLLHKDRKWNWKSEQEQAFKKAKELISSPTVLAHYDGTQTLVLTCDASFIGVGAVIVHRTKEGTERPIAFASRTLSPTEKKYSQLNKEALPIIFGVKKFHQYIAGREFEIFTDHKPLVYLFRKHKGVPH